MKYKNKDGIELNYTGNDTHQQLVREVVSEAVKILTFYDRSSKVSMTMAIGLCGEFLKENFNLEDKNGR